MGLASFIDLRVSVTEQFRLNVLNMAQTGLYLTYGKVTPWANDAAPPNADSLIATVYDIWDNMIGGKQIGGGDFFQVIPRYDWMSGQSYFQYDHSTPNLYEQPFYVVTSDNNVYKCIANNNGSVSTIKPTSVSPYIISETNDGYKWKYMYTISNAEKTKFMTSNYIPVHYLYNDDASLQWQVQTQAVPGAINHIQLTNFGTNYTNANTIIVTVTGDGTGALASASVNNVSHTISSINILNAGQGYTYADVALSDNPLTGGTGATARAIISPPGGHGSNPLYELGASSIMINPRLIYDESNVLPVTNDYRQIALLQDPLLRGTSNAATNTAFLQAYTITAEGQNNFQEDEIVYQGFNLETATFRGTVVSWNNLTNKLLVINTKGTPTGSKLLYGKDSLTFRTVTSSTPGALSKWSGRILYVDNIKPITREFDQIEDFKIVVKF